VNIVKIIVVLLVLAHFIACIWYKVGQAEGDESTAGWVVHHGLRDESFGDRYAWSLHWSLAQFTGEMIFMPRNGVERAFALLVLLVTFIISALFVSSITTSMTRLTLLAGKQPLQLVALRRYLFDLRVPTALIVRMQRNAQSALEEKRRTAPEELLGIISEPLRAEFHYTLYSPALLAHPFLAFYNEINAASIRRVCHAAVAPMPLMRGDVVFNENETPAQPRMLFVVGSGMLRYQQRGEEPEFLSNGHWACEAVLWTHWMHCGVLAAESQCRLLALDAERFRKFVSPYPSRHAGKYAAAFVEQLNRLDRSELSDLWSPDFEEVAERALPDWMRSDTPHWGNFSLTRLNSSGSSPLAARSPAGTHHGPKRCFAAS